MTTSDGPPHELRGPIGQFMDPAAGVPTLVSPTPGPNAMIHARPGLTPQGAMSLPSQGPSLPLDAGSLAIAISQLANEMFAGSSVSGVPGTPTPSAFAGGLPGSPGGSPQLAPSNASHVGPADPASGATHGAGAAPSTGKGGAPPHGAHPVAGANPFTGGLPGSMTNPFAGASSVPGGLGTSGTSNPFATTPFGSVPQGGAIAPNAALSPYASTPLVASPQSGVSSNAASAVRPPDVSSEQRTPNADAHAPAWSTTLGPLVSIGAGAPHAANPEGGSPRNPKGPGPAGVARDGTRPAGLSTAFAPTPTTTRDTPSRPGAVGGAPPVASPSPVAGPIGPGAYDVHDVASPRSSMPGGSALPGGSPFANLAPGSLDAISSIGAGSRGPSGAPYGAAPDFGAFDHGLGSPAVLESFAIPLTGPASFDAAPMVQPATHATGMPVPGSGGHLSIGDATGANNERGVRESSGAFDPYAVRRDFPILDQRVHGDKPLVWLDNAATTQKPRAVIDRLSYFYTHENSNVHRAAHTLAARATDAFERGRESTRRFLNAGQTSEIVFVRGATEGINLVAKTWGKRYIGAGDEIVITNLEHHANIVPWQMLCAETGARLRVAPVDDRGDVILEEYERLMSKRTRLVAFPHVSNALGTITPAREMVAIAHRFGARVLVDGAQAVSHMRVDVQELDCDWYVLSGHKVFAPTGIGAVFGKADVLEESPPWQGGGNMIVDVTFEKTTYQPPPGRFEAGTGSIADAAGLGAALDYVMKIGMDTIDRYEHELLGYGTELLSHVPGLRMIGTSAHKASVMSFVLDGQRTEDVGAMLDADGIAVRSGHHCAQPILRRFGLEATVRASLAFYNVREDVDALYRSLLKIQSNRRSLA